MNNMYVGMHVQYKNKNDKKIYFVIDYSKNENNYPDEVCIIQDFPFHPDKIVQLKIWQRFDNFDVVSL